MPWFRKLHWQIIIGLILGLAVGLLAATYGASRFVTDWIAPWGTIFMNLLKLVAVPLIIASLITGVASLADVKKLSRIGGKVIVLYTGTTAIAIIVGLIVVNVMRPGDSVPADMQQQLQAMYESEALSRVESATSEKPGPLQALVDIVPENLVSSASDNRNMLQIVFIAIFAGIGLLLLPRETAAPLLTLFSSLNDLVVRLVDLIMKAAPFGAFALISGTIAFIAKDNIGQVFELVGALGFYGLTVLVGLALHVGLVYGSLVHFLTPYRIRVFSGKLIPVQLLAFSTSSSNATLPVTMEVVEKEIGVSEEIASFSLPLGATVNMDGTALYQGVATVFIAQAMGIPLDFAAQATIVLTATLASIGTAGVPSAGIVTLVIILQSVGVPIAGIALILGIDRILDMVRTVVNVTGDAVVATLVAHSEGQLTVRA